MAKEFLQKHFINEVKPALNRWSGGGGDSTPNLQDKFIDENGVYSADEGFDGLREVTVEVESSGGTDDRLKQLIEGTITEVSDDTVTSVGTYAFYECKEFTSVNFPNVTSIGDSAFYGCSKLATTYFPLVTSIGQRAFQGTKLTIVDFPLATSLGSSAFQSCKDLTTAYFPLATKIDRYLFQSCSSLTSVSIPNATSIGWSSFNACSELPSLDFSLVTSIDNQAFNGCKVLAALILRSETACNLVDIGAFTNTPFASGGTGGTLLVPRDLVESYKTATNWSVIWGYGHNRFLALEDYTVDGTITGEIDWDKLNGGAA